MNNPKFPALSKEVQKLKTTDGVINAMCEVIEKYINEALEQLQKVESY